MILSNAIWSFSYVGRWMINFMLFISPSEKWMFPVLVYFVCIFSLKEKHFDVLTDDTCSTNLYIIQLFN
uniref:Uncharacterized protein n=1 Tax=Arundo donax TaxID=35708 RepID=A0A0A9D2F8_ARUDO